MRCCDHVFGGRRYAASIAHDKLVTATPKEELVIAILVSPSRNETSTATLPLKHEVRGTGWSFSEGGMVKQDDVSAHTSDFIVYLVVGMPFRKLLSC